MTYPNKKLDSSLKTTYFLCVDTDYSTVRLPHRDAMELMNRREEKVKFSELVEAIGNEPCIIDEGDDIMGGLLNGYLYSKEFKF